MTGIDLPFGWIPEMVSEEFEGELLSGRPGEGEAGRSKSPCFQVTQIGGQGAQGVGAHSFLGQMLKCGDVLVGEQGRQGFAPLQRQDPGECVEFIRAVQFPVAAALGCQSPHRESSRVRSQQESMA